MLFWNILWTPNMLYRNSGKKALFKGHYIGCLLLAQIQRDQPFPNGIDEIGVRR